MQVRELTGAPRELVGKKGSIAVRNEGKVPCVLYGIPEPVHFKLTDLEVERSINTPNVYLYHLTIGGKTYKAIIKDAQFHPTSDKALHIDFLFVDESKKIKVALPIKYVGTPAGVLAGGKLQVKARKLNVYGLLADLPETLDVDITEVTLGHSVKIGKLSFTNLEILDSKNAIACAVKLTRSAMKERTEDEKKK